MTHAHLKLHLERLLRGPSQEELILLLRLPLNPDILPHNPRLDIISPGAIKHIPRNIDPLPIRHCPYITRNRNWSYREIPGAWDVEFRGAETIPVDQRSRERMRDLEVPKCSRMQTVVPSRTPIPSTAVALAHQHRYHRRILRAPRRDRFREQLVIQIRSDRERFVERGALRYVPDGELNVRLGGAGEGDKIEHVGDDFRFGVERPGHVVEAQEDQHVGGLVARCLGGHQRDVFPDCAAYGGEVAGVEVGGDVEGVALGGKKLC